MCLPPVIWGLRFRWSVTKQSPSSNPYHQVPRRPRSSLLDFKKTTWTYKSPEIVYQQVVHKMTLPVDLECAVCYYHYGSHLGLLVGGHLQPYNEIDAGQIVSQHFFYEMICAIHHYGKPFCSRTLRYEITRKCRKQHGLDYGTSPSPLHNASTPNRIRNEA
jgi:hypothetical protein